MIHRRRQREESSSSDGNSVALSGLAHLCFADDGSWFQGTFNDGDMCEYTIYGKKIDSDKSANVYHVTVVDLEACSDFVLPRVMGNKGRLQCSEVTFESTSEYKGMKADLIIQKHLGSPSLLGKNCRVYHGPLKINYTETVPVCSGTGVQWCL